MGWALVLVSQKWPRDSFSIEGMIFGLHLASGADSSWVRSRRRGWCVELHVEVGAEKGRTRQEPGCGTRQWQPREGRCVGLLWP